MSTYLNPSQSMVSMMALTYSSSSVVGLVSSKRRRGHEYQQRDSQPVFFYQALKKRGKFKDLPGDSQRKKRHNSHPMQPPPCGGGKGWRGGQLPITSFIPASIGSSKRQNQLPHIEANQHFPLSFRRRDNNIMHPPEPARRCQHLLRSEGAEGPNRHGFRPTFSVHARAGRGCGR